MSIQKLTKMERKYRILQQEQNAILKRMQEEKRKMSKNEKLQGKYDRFRCFFIYQNEKNYDKIGG